MIAALIAATFKLLQDAHDSFDQLIRGSGGSISGLVGTNGVFAVSDIDKELLRQIFSVACGFGTDVSVNVISTDSTTTSNTSGSTNTVSPLLFAVTVTLPDGTKIVLPTFPFIALDLISQFHLLTGSDIIELVRKLIHSIFDMIIAPLKTTIDLIKLIKMTIDSKIPPAMKLQIMSPDIINLLQLSVIPALELVEPVLKEIAWIGTTALCAVASPVTNYLPVAAARMIHPIMNQDDLPPWERLTHKNPLFAIFLDEIAWRGSIYSTGSLIFQTKTPAVLPYSPTFPIMHISPHLT
jgi:hypothetical protein